MRALVSACAAAALMVAGGIVGAQAQEASPSSVPASAVFAGAGTSVNSVAFTDQTLYSQGVSRIYQGGVLVGAGSASGSMDPGFSSSATFSGMAQFGYFQHFQGTEWLWGVKATYNYLGGSGETRNVAVPQAGSFTSATPATFTGNVVGQSYVASVDNQMALVPFIGRSFEKGFLYLGAGPTVSRVKYSFNNVIGFAAIDSVHYDITGLPSSYASSDWVVGGEVVVGGTYFFAPSWFIDLNYTYGVTKGLTEGYAGPFSTSTHGYDDVGILSGYFEGGSTTQTALVSINKAF